MITSQVIDVINAIFCIVIAVPLISYHGYKYYLNRNHIVFSKRYAFITIIEVIFAVIKFLIDSILFIVLSHQKNISIFNMKPISRILLSTTIFLVFG